MPYQRHGAKGSAVRHRPLAILLLVVAVVAPAWLVLGSGASHFGLTGAPSGDRRGAATQPARAKPDVTVQSAPADAAPGSTAERPAPSEPESDARQQPAAFCQPGEAPAFEGRFADLHARLGETMGEPLECVHPRPQSGDLLQMTTRGLAIDYPASGTVRFTDGWRHWALSSGDIVAWEGPSSDPPDERLTEGAATLGVGAPSEQTPSTLQEQPAVMATGDDAEASRAEEAGSAPRVYVVQPGDQLRHIAGRFDIGLWELARANGIDNPDRLRVGQPLVIPGQDGRDSNAP